MALSRLLSVPILLAAACAFAADPVPCYWPGAVAGQCTPIDPAATAGQWTLWDTQPAPGHAFRRHADWPSVSGNPLPGMDPRYLWLAEQRVDPPSIDSRLQTIPYPCPETVSLTAYTITTTCEAQVRPAAELHGAVANAAAERIEAALAAIGFSDPADLVRAFALVQARAQGQTLTAAQSDWLAALAGAGIEYVDQVRAVQASIDAWIDAHPGQLPDIGPSVWPAIPGAE